MATAVGDVFRFAGVQRLYLQEVVNTFAFRIESQVAPVDEGALISAFFAGDTSIMNTRIKNTMRAVQSQDLAWEHWNVQKVSPAPMMPVTVPCPAPLAGLVEEAAETANTAACITRYGLAAGRRNRGRIAVAGIVPELYEEGLVGTLLHTGLELVGQSITGTYDSLALQISISFGFWSPAHTGIVNGLPVVYPPLYVPCPNYFVRDSVRVQRSRTRGVGS